MILVPCFQWFHNLNGEMKVFLRKRATVAALRILKMLGYKPLARSEGKPRSTGLAETRIQMDLHPQLPRIGNPF